MMIRLIRTSQQEGLHDHLGVEYDKIANSNQLVRPMASHRYLPHTHIGHTALKVWDSHPIQPS